jgi:hypothetical protein
VAKTTPSPSEVLQRYVAAVGRIVPAAEPRTIIATRATPRGGPVAMKVLESGDDWRVDITLPDGTALTQTLTGKGGWISDKSGVRELNSEEVTAVRMSRRPFAPFTESSFGTDATVSSEKIGDQDVWVVATVDARYSFDAESGFLLRRVVFYDSPMGRIPEQTEFDHYRKVGDAKVPFTSRIELVDPWLGGTRQATTIVIGTPISPAEFVRPPAKQGS